MAKLASRRRHTNSKLGCANCKRKKIRCDEELPQCLNCRKGRKETCSYLSLSSAEINRIKLTHSLRNSQDKLLASSFRLPTSTNSAWKSERLSLVVRLPDEKNGDDNMLEFKFEFSMLESKYPMLRYPSVQFHNVFVDSIDSEYGVDHDYRSPSDPHFALSEILSSSESIAAPNEKGLPNCIQVRTTFTRLNHRALFDKSFFKYNPICTLLHRFSPELVFSRIFFVCQKTFGASLLLLRIKQDSIIGRSIQKHAITSLESKCIAAANEIRQLFPEAIRVFQHNLRDEKQPVHEMNTQRLYLAFANWLAATTLSVLDCSIPTVFTFLVGQSIIFEEYLSHALKHDNTEVSGVQWLSLMKKNILFIHLPPYEPAFLFEMRCNLEVVFGMLKNPIVTFENQTDLLYYKRLKYYCGQMLEFLETEMLPVVYSSRNEHFVTTYPPSLMYNVVRKWVFLMPNKFNLCVNNTLGNTFLRYLSDTVKMYRAAISVGLDAVFPTARYLLSLGFEDPTFTMHQHCSYAKPLLDDFEDASFSELIWRHNVYALRIYSFFRRRFDLYRNHVIWKGSFSDINSSNRFSARHMKNALEIPVRSFSHLPLSPEHYARQIHGHYDSILKDPSASAVYTRPDDPNERLFQKAALFDLFDLSHEVNLTPTLSCQYDYVPDIGKCMEETTHSFEDLKNYFEDRKCILQGIF